MVYMYIYLYKNKQEREFNLKPCAAYNTINKFKNVLYVGIYYNKNFI